jgi:predicted acyltransferase
MDSENVPSGRIRSIDYFRGFTIILMIAVNYLSGIDCVPAFLKHAPNIGLTITDLVAPAFIFAIGLTYKRSFDRRAARDGLKSAYYHFAMRFLAFVGIGAFFTGGAALVKPEEALGAWGVLQAIGAAGLIALLFICLGTWARLAVGLALLLAYQLMLDHFWLSQVLGAAQGGLQASLSWGALLLLSTVLADLYFKQSKNKLLFAAVSTAVLAAGLLSALLFAVSKHQVSLSYILISAGASSLAIFLFDAWDRLVKVRLAVLEWWGSNPLLLYLIHMVLLGVTFIPGSEAWYKGAPPWSAALQLAGFFSVLCLLAWGFYRKKVHLSL